HLKLSHLPSNIVITEYKPSFRYLQILYLILFFIYLFLHIVKSSVFLYLFTGLLDSFATFKLSLFQTSGLKHKLWSKKYSIIFCILTVSGFIFYSSFIYLIFIYCVLFILYLLFFGYIFSFF